MTLTLGRGPFGHFPGGHFNFTPPESVSYLEEFPRWMRARLGGETVADSKRAKLLHESGALPRLLFPEDDVRLDVLPDQAVSRPGPEGLVELDWHAMDEWLEEDEVAIGHVRDPYHRTDARASSRRVRVSLHGQTLAESGRTVALFETGLPTRWYFPPEDVRMDLLAGGGSQTVCAYKGQATHLSFGDDVDIAWTYASPEREVAPLQERIAFYNERVDLEVDGGPQERPRTPWWRD